jgi:hypothetical protein
VDVILAGMLLEALALGVWTARRHERLLGSVMANLAAGACLLFALRSALHHQEVMVWPALALALAAHVADLRTRFQTR